VRGARATDLGHPRATDRAPLAASTLAPTQAQAQAQAQAKGEPGPEGGGSADAGAEAEAAQHGDKATAPATGEGGGGLEGGGSASGGAEVKAVPKTRRKKKVAKREELVLISHNVKDFTSGSKDKSESVADLEERLKRLEERLANLKRCYEVEGPSASADVLIIQEVMNGDGGRDAAQKLTDALSRPSRDYRLLLSDAIGDGEAAAFIYDAKKFESLGCKVGVPIAPGSHLLPLTSPLPDAFAYLCGFEDAEMCHHTYFGADPLDEVSHLDDSRATDD
jgi:hypothetical protein